MVKPSNTVAFVNFFRYIPPNMLFIESKEDRQWDWVEPEDRSNVLFLGIVDRAVDYKGQLIQSDYGSLNAISRRRRDNASSLLESQHVEEYLSQFMSQEAVLRSIRGSYWGVPFDIRRMIDYWFGRPRGFNILLEKVNKLEEEYPNSNDREDNDGTDEYEDDTDGDSESIEELF